MQDEFQIIDFIKDFFASPFIGDDAAVIPLNDKENIVISKDILIENIHFILNSNLSHIGSKSLISNLSDIIAMGIEPKYFFLGLGVPDCFSIDDLSNLLNGVRIISEKYNVVLAGGDTSGAERLSISVTVVGFGGKDRIIYRHGAELGDYIYVTGNLGDSEIGLSIIKGDLNFEQRLSEYFVNCHYIRELYPEFISFLSFKKLINSMIDISDGFLQDLNHILFQSKKRARVDETLIPVSKEFRSIISKMGNDALTIPLTSGEEYQIIFTAPPSNHADIMSYAENFSVKVTKVGEITDNGLLGKQNIKLKNLEIEKINKLGYSHF